MAGTRVVMIETPIFSHYVRNALCRTSCGVEIVGTAANAGVALELIRTHQPDVLIIDIRNESFDGLDTLMKIRSEYPSAPIIGRAKKPSYEYTLQAIAAGVRGFINDQTSFSELMEAVRAVQQGYAYIPQNLARQFMIGLQNVPLILH